jgi:ArsR family transcriptional regulator, arsenate/arsenite/antimonite-responsive transcriptional repressor
MSGDDIVTALSAMGQNTRLKTVMTLMKQAPHGLPATEIASRLGVRKNTMSAHLKVLENAGLLAKRRDGRGIIYSAVTPAIQRVADFLQAMTQA